MISANSRDILGIVLSLTTALVISILVYRRTSPSIPRKHRFFLAILRFLGVCIIMLWVLSPSVQFVTRRVARPVVAFLIDTSRSMVYPDSTENAVRFRKLPDLISRIAQRSDVRILSFSSDAEEISNSDLPLLRAVGLRTDIASALSKLRNLDPKPSSVVLLSDGANNFGDDPVYSASLLRIPIHTIIASSEKQTPDIAIEKVSEIGTCYAGTDIAFWIEVSGRCEKDVSTQLRITDSTGIVYSSEVVVPGRGATYRIPVSISCGNVGLHRFRAELFPFEGERVTSNNSLGFAIKVIKGKIRVFVIASKPSWDFAFAVRGLRENPAFEVSTYFVDPQVMRLSTDPSEGIKKISSSDVVIVFAEALSVIASRTISEYLNHGGNIILIGSTEGVASDFSPFTTSGRSGEFKQGHAYPTDAGKEHEVTKLGGGGFVWEKLPPISVPSSITGSREGCLVLLEARTERESQPLLVVSKVGQGRVVGFAAVDLWKWDLSPSGFGLNLKAFSQILLNLVNWLSEQSELSTISISTSKFVYLVGEPVNIVVRIADPNLKPLPGLTVSAKITNQSSPDDLISINMNDLGNGNYACRLDLLEPGRYSIDVRAEYEGRILAANAEFDVDSRGLEDSNFDGDRGLLERISSASGGKAYDPDEIENLVNSLELSSFVRDVTRVLRFDLGVGSFILAVCILGLEWLLRRRRLLI